MTRRFLTFLLDILPGLILLTALALALWAATGQRLTAYDPASPSTGHGEARTAPEWPRTRGAGSDALTRLPTPPGEPQTDQGTSGVFAVLPGAPDVQDPLPDLSAADRRDSGAAPLGAPPQAAKGGSAAPRLAAIGTSLSAGPTPTANPRLTKQNLATAAPSVDAGSCTTPCFVRVPPDPWHRAVATSYGIGDGYLWGHMACGGRLTPTALVVAHRTLPCGTVVTFRFTRRHAPISGAGNCTSAGGLLTCVVTAVVRDRGPFVAGRTWDFGPAVARALHFNGLDWVDWRLE